MDILRDMGMLFLGSRLKRLGERMQADVIRVIQSRGVDVQPSQYPLLAALDRYGAMTVNDMVSATGVSQPAVTRSLSLLVEQGLVETHHLHRDQRHKTISLTAAGQDILRLSKQEIWPQVEAAAVSLCGTHAASLLSQIGAIEDALASEDLYERVQTGPMAGLSILPFNESLASDFHDINLEWITQMYRVERTDRDVLEHPLARIIEPGGRHIICCGQRSRDRRNLRVAENRSIGNSS